MDGLTIAYRECEPGYFDSGRSLEEACLIGCVADTVHCVYEGGRVWLHPGEYLLMPPGIWHMLYAEGEEAPILLTVTFPVSDGNFAPITGSTGYLARILEEYRLDDAYASQMCGLYMQQLLITLRRRQAFRPRVEPRGDAAILCRAQKLIGAHAREKLSVPMLAQRTGVSASYLTALFHKYLPFSPGEYIRRVKLWESRAMIREGKLNFTQIAQALEYSTVHQFSRQFKEVFGITPTEYAKSARTP